MSTTNPQGEAQHEAGASQRPTSNWIVLLDIENADGTKEGQRAVVPGVDFFEALGGAFDECTNVAMCGGVKSVEIAGIFNKSEVAA